MPDWRASEFEGKFKDEFARSNNNEHENGVGALNITSKKLKHGADNEKSSQGVVSEANNSDSQKCNSEHIQSSNEMVFHDTNRDDECMRDCNVDSDAFPLSAKDTIPETRYPTDNWNSCHFALSDGSPVVNNHNVPQNGLNYGDNDLPYIDWPGIDNFEDVDTLFRRCDSTYGQQQLENADELSWLPSSSDAIYSSNVGLQPGFESSYPEYGILDDLAAYHCPEDKSLSTPDPSAAVCDKQFNDNYPFSEESNMNVYGEKAYEGDAMELLPADQICNGHSMDEYENLDMIGSQYSTDNALEQLIDEKFSIGSASQLSSCQNLLKQKHLLDSTSPSNVTSESYPESNNHLSTPQASFAKVQKKVANLRQRHPNNVGAGHPSPQTGTRQASYPDEKGLGERSLEVPKVVTDSSMIVDGSFVSSISSDNSVEESSFRRLQDAVNQLDVKTKLCLRDGLYRLARSAQHRQVFPNTINSNGDSQDTKEMQNAENLGKFVEPVNIETQTNPIDRSIAMLLFHHPPGRVNGTIDDASSLKPHISNENHEVPTKNQGVLPASPIYSPRGKGGSINVKSCENC